MKLLHDPANGPLPSGLAQWHVTEVDFRTRPGGILGERCPRCGFDLNVHVWQLVDPNEPEQGGVLDCGGDRW